MKQLQPIVLVAMVGVAAYLAVAENRPASDHAATPVPAGEKKNYDKPGFVTILDKHGRLWVFRADSKELTEFREKGEPVKVVIRPRSGPDGLTLKSTDLETIEAYLAAPQAAP